MVSLSRCPKGSKVRVLELCEDPGCRCRLCSMGLTPGVEAVIRQDGESCRVCVRGDEICLGNGLADQIKVVRV
ncbi:FeoA family protein [Fundidesulfovibrio soli]|uniref:FeoA family protein n=1 Tax=Fundidesulfovibrio soli TaxID=2922716 RepID=UPI001FB0496E|nr:ferrous iron transport protein A [Fundidesulfovibrio soli]